MRIHCTAPANAERRSPPVLKIHSIKSCVFEQRNLRLPTRSLPQADGIASTLFELYLGSGRNR